MLRLSSIRAHNIGPFSDLDIDLEALPRVVAVVGGNGQGKSSLLELLAGGALYRECPTRGPLTGLAQGRDSWVEVRCSNGVPWTIRQTVDAVSGRGESLVLDASGAPVLSSTKLREYDGWATAHLPPREVLYASTFGVQGDAGFLALRPGERKGILLRVLGIERLEGMARRAGERRRECLSTIERVDARLAEVRGPTLAEAKAALGIAVSRQLDASMRATATGQAADAIREELDAWDRRVAHANEDAEARAVAEAKVSKFRAQLADLTTRAANNQALLEQADAIREAFARARAIPGELAALNVQGLRSAARAAGAKADALSRELAAARLQLGDLDHRRKGLLKQALRREDVKKSAFLAAELREQIARGVGEVDEIRRELDVAGALVAAGLAPRVEALRGALTEIADGDDYDNPPVARAALVADDAAALAAAEAPERLRRARAAEDGYRRRCDEAAQRLAKLDAEAATLPALEAAAAELDALAGQVGALEARVLNLSAEHAAAAHEAVEAVAVASRADDRVAVLEREAAKLAAAERRHEHLVAAEARLEELRPQVERAEEELAAAERALAALPPAGPPPRPNVDLELAERVHRDAVEASAQAMRSVALAERAVDEASQAEARRAELGVERVRAAEELADWTHLEGDLGRNGLQALEIDAAGPELSALANDLLHTCVGPRWTVSVDTQRLGADGRLLESLEVRVLDTEAGREAPVETFSGGERVLIGEAVSLALAMLGVRASGQRDVSIIRDESGAALDPENGRAWIAMLRRAMDIVGARQCLFVSHSAEVAELADARLVVADGKVEVA